MPGDGAQDVEQAAARLGDDFHRALVSPAAGKGKNKLARFHTAQPSAGPQLGKAGGVLPGLWFTVQAAQRAVRR